MYTIEDVSTACVWTTSGGNVWLHGEGGEGPVHSGADEVGTGQERLHTDPDHQQEDQHQVLFLCI